MAHLPQVGLKQKNKVLETIVSYFGFVKKQLTIVQVFKSPYKNHRKPTAKHWKSTELLGHFWHSHPLKQV